MVGEEQPDQRMESEPVRLQVRERAVRVMGRLRMD